MTTEIGQLVNSLRTDGGAEFAAENHIKISNEIEKLDKLIKFAIEGLSSYPRSLGLDITHIQRIKREMSGD